MRRLADVTIYQEPTRVGFAFSQEIAAPKIERRMSDHECEDQTLCDLERWV
jgi:hypothetical protein